MNAISLEPLNQSTSHLVYDVISPKGRTLLILGHVQKLRWPPLNFLICMLYTPLVNAISLEPLNQSTSNLVYDVIPPKGRTLLILGHVRKTRWPPSNFLICLLLTPLVNAISLEPLNQSTSDLVYDVIPPKGRTLLILGHLLKTRWPLLNFWNICTVVKIMLVNAISLKPFPQSTSNLKFVFILSIGQVLLILGHLLKPRWPLSWFKKWL